MILRDINLLGSTPPDSAVEAAFEPSSLQHVDWNFSKRAKTELIEAIHPYPAKFIGEIPRALMQCLPLKRGTAVLDPFMGSGTTLVEAQKRGFKSVGIDLNPIACMIARVKTGPNLETLVDLGGQISSRARLNTTPKRWSIPNLDHWFKPSVQCQVAALLEEIDAVSDKQTFEALRLALSAILVRVSNQDSDTRYAAIEKRVSGEDVHAQFIAACKRVQQALFSRSWNQPTSSVLESNTLALTADSINRPIGLVITSPPYPNAYEYWLYHKYRMFWLGHDPLRVKEQEIGARAHFFKRNHHTANDFVTQMRTVLLLIREVLVRDGHACFVIGRSKIHGKIVDNAKIIEDAALDLGFHLAGRFERVISSTRKSFNLSHANIKTESVLVLKKSAK